MKTTRILSLLAAALVAVGMMTGIVNAQAAGAPPSNPFKDAVKVWHFADAAGLKAEGAAKTGVKLAGAEKAASLARGGDGYAARFDGGWLAVGDGEAGLGFNPHGMNDINHVGRTSVVEWIFEQVAGVQLPPDANGFKKFILKPQVGGGVDWVRIVYDSVRGAIESNWKKDHGRFTWNVTVPPNTTATVHIPAAAQDAVTESGNPINKAQGVKFLKMENGRAVDELQSGSYTFEAEMDEK